jgi:hypothetical protein
MFQQIINFLTTKITYKIAIPIIIFWALLVWFLPNSIFGNILHYLYLLVGLFLACVVAYWLFLYTEYGVYIFAFLIPFQLYVIPSNYSSVAYWFVKILFIITIFKILIRKLNVFYNPITNWIFLYVFLVLISTVVYQENYKEVLLNNFNSLYIISLIIFYVILININNKQKIKILLYVLMFSGVVCTCIGLYFMTRGEGYAGYLANTYWGHLIHGYNLYILKETPDLYRTALHGTFANKNYYAAFMSVSFCLSYCFMLFGKGKIKIFYIFLFIFFLVSMFLASSRGAIMGMVVSLICMNFLYSRKNIKLYLYVVGIVLILLFLLYFFSESILDFINNPLIDNVLSKWNLNYLEHSKDTRLYTCMLPSWEMFLKSPIIGNGAIDLASHNWMLDVLLRTGVIGMIIWIIIFYKIFKVSVKNFIFNNDDFYKTLSLSLIGICVYFLVHGAVSRFMNHRAQNMIFWLSYALTMIDLNNTKNSFNNIQVNINKMVVFIGIFVFSLFVCFLIFKGPMVEVYFYLGLIYVFILSNFNKKFSNKNQKKDLL